LFDKADISGILPVNRMIIRLAKVNKTAARAFINVSVQALAKKPAIFFEASLKSISPHDRMMLEQGDLKRQLIDWFSESTRQGTEHLAEEILYIFNDWHIDPKQLKCPVTIWHGLADKHAPPVLMQRFAENLPHCKSTHWLPEQGHYLLFSQWAAIINELKCLKTPQ